MRKKKIALEAKGAFFFDRVPTRTAPIVIYYYGTTTRENRIFIPNWRHHYVAKFIHFRIFSQWDFLHPVTIALVEEMYEFC